MLGLLLATACATADPATTGRGALARGDYPQARRDLTQAVQTRQDDAHLWRDLARAHMRDGDNPQARAAIDRAAALAPKDTSVVLLRGQIRMGGGDRPGALQDARYAASTSADPRELQETAILLLRLGQPDAALEAAGRAVERSGGEASAYTNLAVLAVEARRPQVAANALRDGRARHPKDIPLAQAQAAFLMERRDLPGARRVYESMLPRHPNPGLVHQALALITHALQDLDAAGRHARAAVDALGTQRPSVHYTLVVILRDRGESQAADQALRRALRRFPHDRSLLTLRSAAPETR